MEQYGEVIGVEGDIAAVRFKRSKACGKCRACFTLGSDEALIEIENILNAKVGDIVEIQQDWKEPLSLRRTLMPGLKAC